jgi:hypothetical protein
MRRKFRLRNTARLYTAIAPNQSWYSYYRADRIKVPSSLAEAAHTEVPDLAARFFAYVEEPPATTSLRVDVPTHRPCNPIRCWQNRAIRDFLRRARTKSVK